MKKLHEMEKAIEHKLVNLLGLHAGVKLVEPKSIERFEGKAKRVLDLRPKE